MLEDRKKKATVAEQEITNPVTPTGLSSRTPSRCLKNH
jgi:hypothetical protein